MAFFGRLLFRCAAFVFRHWFSLLCLHATVIALACTCLRVWAHVHICWHSRTRKRQRCGGGGQDATYMIMYPSSFHVFLSSGLITLVFGESSWRRMAFFCYIAAKKTLWHSYKQYMPLLQVKTIPAHCIYPLICALTSHASFTLLSFAGKIWEK